MNTEQQYVGEVDRILIGGHEQSMADAVGCVPNLWQHEGWLEEWASVCIPPSLDQVLGLFLLAAQSWYV